jgi:metal-responsive CopG/Arc/MetJ family transcriptional regulator
MKAIQFTIDENLLTELDAAPEVQRDGRSAVLRRAVSTYLRDQRKQTVAERYRKAYGQDGGLGAEYAGWEDQGQWPEE